jgi:hypothetical protein
VCSGQRGFKELCLVVVDEVLDVELGERGGTGEYDGGWRKSGKAHDSGGLPEMRRAFDRDFQTMDHIPLIDALQTAWRANGWLNRCVGASGHRAGGQRARSTDTSGC